MLHRIYAKAARNLELVCMGQPAASRPQTTCQHDCWHQQSPQLTLSDSLCATLVACFKLT